MRRVAVLAVLGGLAATASACSAILGIGDLPTANDASPNDSSTDEDAAHLDGGSGTDASPVNDSSITPNTDAAFDAGCAYAFCENFERYSSPTNLVNGATLGQWSVTVAGSASVSIDSIHAYRGANAFHVEAPSGNPASGYLSFNSPGSTGIFPSQAYFGRLMILFSTDNGGALPDIAGHSYFFNSTGPFLDAGNIRLEIGTADQLPSYALTFLAPGMAPTTTTAGTPPGAGGWHCWQWEASASDGAKLSVDGTQVVTGTGNLSSAWSTFYFGLNAVDALTNNIEFYVDEFALDTSQVPCPL